MAYNILVVDDDEHTHVIVKSILKDEFDLIHANDGQEAILILYPRRALDRGNRAGIPLPRYTGKPQPLVRIGTDG